MRVQIATIRIFGFCLLASAAVSAEPSPAARDSVQRQSYADLFAEILRELPPADRAKVDSAALPRPALNEAAVPKVKKSHGEEISEAKQKGLDALPLEVRERVEKAVVNLEERKKKGLEFKELRK